MLSNVALTLLKPDSISFLSLLLSSLFFPRSGIFVYVCRCSLLLQLYSVVRAENPDAFQRIVAISGDISLPNLGISEEDEKTLAKNVSVVFHLAASIQFNSSLRFEQPSFSPTTIHSSLSTRL